MKLQQYELDVRYKARLVVKQQFGVDYVKTSAPTVCAPTLQTLLLFAAQKGSAVHQCDVKNAYLNSSLQNDIIIYSELPPKYKSFRELPPELKDKPNVVCKWLVSVYRSKQGAHDWYAEVKKFFIDLGYSVSVADEAVFYKLDDNTYTIVAAATDDFTVIADSTESANLLIQKQLTERFEISDLGPINWLLGSVLLEILPPVQSRWDSKLTSNKFSVDSDLRMLTQLSPRWR